MEADVPLSYLFVPGHRPERFAKALASGADRVIIDLEDAVSPSDKAAAREAIAAWMPSASAEIRGQLLIRINDASTGWYADDLQLLRQVGAACVMLPKCESVRQIADALGQLGAGATALPLVETARGLLAVSDLATAPGVARLAFGSLDYMADLDIPADSPALQYAAVQLVVASRAAGLPSPVAGVTPDIDANHVAADMAQARRLGFGAKMCIHPAQVCAVHRALRPGDEEQAWAQRILDASRAAGGGAVLLDGKMVDRPVVLKAGRIVAMAARTPDFSQDT
ncbi:HpcH/HpaI aldolase/citrate lyase family protein [Polaromonas sp. YR568]|uniref:HpcH/HpaI aldolase/citrate lyase family protein n=1 Tax=Polaromonas sp. YR568 TaxID=1855301 RepID=UPI00398BF394